MSTATLPKAQPVAIQHDVASQIIAPHQENSESDGPRKRLISAHDYMRMAEIGLFEGQRVELIDGDIIAMPPMSEAHAQSVDNIHEELGEPFRGTFKIRGQNLFNAGEHGRPEPDIAVVRREALRADEPPAEAVLIVEVSRSTLHYDQTTKASLYASIGIADYWIVNLIENQVEVYRQPIPSQSAQFGHDYASRQIYRSGQSIALLEVPEVSIAVDAMLP